MTVTWQLHILRPSNLPGKITTAHHCDSLIADPLKHQSLNMNGWQYSSNVNAHIQAHNMDSCAWAGTHPQIFRPPLAKLWVIGSRRCSQVNRNGAAPFFAKGICPCFEFFRGTSPRPV